MKHLKNKINHLGKTAVVCVGFGVLVLVLSVSVKIARAVWEEPSAQAPEGNIYAPLNVGPDDQAKKGRLLLDSFYDPAGLLPQIEYPLEVKGAQNAYINTLEIDKNLTVDTDTLYVDSTARYVGIGTLTPATKLEIVGGVVSVGSSASPINNMPAIIAGSDAGYGAYGQSLAADQPSVYGKSDTGAGVYGFNALGYGLYAESGTGSAVKGEADMEYSSPTVVAGIYGSAAGLGAWAGYFEQRLSSSEAAVGRKFLPNRLQNSQVPYTAGWEVKQITDSIVHPFSSIAFDGKNLWVGSGGWGWYSYLDVVDAATGTFVREIDLTGYYVLSRIIYADGYIWATVSGLFYEPILLQIDPNTFAVTRRQISDESSRTPLDMVYDNVTAGGPYIWIASRGTAENNMNYVYRYKISDGTVYPASDPPITVAGKCPSYVPSQCTDKIDNDGDGKIDGGVCGYPAFIDQAACEQPANGGTWNPAYCEERRCENQTDCVGSGAGQCNSVWHAGFCSNDRCTVQAACTGAKGCGATWDSVAGTCSDSFCTTQPTCVAPKRCAGTWYPPDEQCQTPVQDFAAPDERISNREIGWPSGITFDGTNLWLSFARNPGEGIAKIQATAPYAAALYCGFTGRRPSDITYDTSNDRAWVSYGPDPENGYRIFSGYAKFNPSTGKVEEEYTPFSKPGLIPPLNEELRDYAFNRIQYDGQSSGGPYIWASYDDWYYESGLEKFDINSNSISQRYVFTGSIEDFTFDRRDENNPYVWGAHSSSFLTRNKVNPPYESVSYVPRGMKSGDVLFDGTYIWESNIISGTVGKYRINDGRKIGDYEAGPRPDHLFYDGTYIWTISYGEQTKTISKLKAATGEKIGTYTHGSGVSGSGTDALFDGKNIWISYSDRLHKIDLSSCSGSSCTSVTNYATNPANKEPAWLALDGEYIWFSHYTFDLSDSISRIKTDGTLSATDTFQVLEDKKEGNIRTMIFDGTYLWLGLEYADSQGNSVYKVDPRTCATGTPGTCTVAGKYQIYYYPGRCTKLPNQPYCRADVDCGVGNFCTNDPDSDRNMISGVDQLLFDGTYIWATNMSGRYSYLAEECRDGIDNDRDGKTDYNDPGLGDPDCGDSYDFHESTTGVECDDNIDNDGNGLCDYDGATGSPGCSGKPDPGCSSAAETQEKSNADARLTRIVAATGQVVESVPYGEYCSASGMAFDGTNIWFGTDGCGGGALQQYYSGSGGGTTDLYGSVALQRAIFDDLTQAGGFSLGGSANFGAKLTVVGDLVVPNNTWAGAGDTMKAFGAGCDEGRFAKGLDLNTSQLQCRGL